MDSATQTKYTIQKWLFISIIVLVNATLITLAQVYAKYWYYVQIPLLIVFFFNVATIFLISFSCLFKTDKKLDIEAIPQRTIAFFIPCYNQSAQQIQNSLTSFFNQSELDTHKKVYITVCDGRKTGKGNSLSTDQILCQIIFRNAKRIKIKNAYLDSENVPVDVEILHGTCDDNFPFFVIIKDQNKGKRDSIAILRRTLIRFNTKELNDKIVSEQLIHVFSDAMKKHGINKIDHVIGVDADTVFDKRCTIELLREIERKENILASTGMVKVSFPEGDSFLDRLWQGYQHVEYIAGQGLLRNQQQLTQQKINCLPGCLNITRVNEKTCGEKMLSQYMEPPSNDNHIFQRIRGTASEDRHSVMLLLKLYGDCHTTVNWNAQAETGVPLDLRVFLSQRKRWSLGSATHGLWMIFMENIPIWERFSSAIFVLTYILCPFLLYSLIIWISIVIRGTGDQAFWILTGAVQVITFYKLLIPIWVPFTAKERLNYYLFYLLYFFCSPVVSVLIFTYSLYHMDDFGWGKTRETKEPQVLHLIQNTQGLIKTTANINSIKEIDSSTPAIA